VSARHAVAALALLVAAPAASFVRSTTETGVPLAWPVPLVSYHESSAPAFNAPSCAGDATLAAVRASFAAWRASCSDLELLDAGPLDEIRTGLGGTGENVVVFRQGWCSNNLEAVADGCLDDPEVDCGGIFNCFEDQASEDRNTLALTSVLYFPDTGRIVDADIEMNGWDGVDRDTAIVAGASSAPAHGWYFTCDAPEGLPRCATYGQQDCYYADLQNTLTHEVGHFVGLRHVCNGGDETDLPACEPKYAQITMYPSTAPGDVTKRTLDEDDVAGVCAIYPSSDGDGDGDGGGCGCGAGGAPGALAALLAAATLWPRRRRRRAPEASAGQATSTPA
jgi:MYXO-CTERM domain-containing protein